MRRLLVAFVAALALTAAPSFLPAPAHDGGALVAPRDGAPSGTVARAARLLSSTAQAAPIPVHPGDPVVMVGDSITAQGWYSDTASLVGGTGLLVNQILPPLVGPRRAVVTGNVGLVAAGARPSSVASVTGGGQINAINSGVSGNKIGDIEAAIPARITNFSPKVVVIEVGVNDNRGLNTGVPTPLATFRASYDNVLATTISAIPTVKIVCIGIIFIQEKWATGPPPVFSGNPYDVSSGGGFTPSITEYNTEVQGSCVGHGGTYVDVRTPAALQESISNTPAPGAVDGVLSLAADGVHPSAAGQLVMSTAAAAAFVGISP